MKTKLEKCPQCGIMVQSYNMDNHLKNHELEKKAAQKAAENDFKTFTVAITGFCHKKLIRKTYLQ